MPELSKSTSTTFRRAIAGAVMVGASMLGATGNAEGQSRVTPIVAPAGTDLKQLGKEQCKFLVQSAIEMAKSFKPDHFSPTFKRSIGSFFTDNLDCAGKPVFEIGKPEDDRGVLMMWKTMYDNKKGNLLDSVVVYDPKGIAPLSKVLKPERVVRTLPPEFASTGTVGAGPRG
jgi:hypothetical protein